MNKFFSTTGKISSLVFPVGPYSFEEGDGFFKRDSSSNHQIVGSKGGVFDIAIADIDEMDKDPQKCFQLVGVTVRRGEEHFRSRIDKDTENDVYFIFIYDCDEVVSNDFTV